MEKKIAIMQPYFFPYIGYWQLIHAVDCFVIYDEGHYIKRGWINRNRILRNGTEISIGLPIAHATVNKSIGEHELCNQNRDKLNKKFLTDLYYAYGKAKYYEETRALLEPIIMFGEGHLVSWLENEIVQIADYLDIKTRFIRASEISKCESNTAMEKVISICEAMNIYHYINAIGGRQYYDKEDFLKGKVELQFISTNQIKYSQLKRSESEFIPNLSIIDVLMNCGRVRTMEYLNEYTLI